MDRLLNRRPSVSNDNHVGFFATYLVLEKRVPDIFCHSGHDQNITLAFLVSMNVDTIAERAALVSNRSESAGAELARSWVGIDCDRLLKQPLPSFVLVVALERVVTVLRAQPV